MANTDHEGYKKIQCWIPLEMWDKISLQYPNQTNAVTEAFKLLLKYIPNNPNKSLDIPRLTATIEGLQLLLQEKDERIQDLKKENDRLDFYAQFFKSFEYRQLEAKAKEVKQEVKTQDEKTARNPTRTHTENKEKALIRNTCKNCGEEFETYNPKKETCSNKCRSAYSRRNK